MEWYLISFAIIYQVIGTLACKIIGFMKVLNFDMKVIYHVDRDWTVLVFSRNCSYVIIKQKGIKIILEKLFEEVKWMDDVGFVGYEKENYILSPQCLLAIVLESSTSLFSLFESLTFYEFYKNRAELPLTTHVFYWWHTLASLWPWISRSRWLLHR